MRYEAVDPLAIRLPTTHLDSIADDRATENGTEQRTEDRKLAGRAARGDVSAFDRLVRDHSGLVQGVALRVLGARDAQDAGQEVWIRVWRNMGSFRGESSFTTWLYRVATNTCLGLLRTRARREERQHHGEEMPFLPERAGADADPEAAALNAERRGEIETALAYVRAEHRAALVLRHMQGPSYAEIAEVLGVPDGTAKGWVNRGRASMLVALTRETGGPQEVRPKTGKALWASPALK